MTSDTQEGELTGEELSEPEQCVLAFYEKVLGMIAVGPPTVTACIALARSALGWDPVENADREEAILEPDGIQQAANDLARLATTIERNVVIAHLRSLGRGAGTKKLAQQYMAAAQDIEDLKHHEHLDDDELLLMGYDAR